MPHECDRVGEERRGLPRERTGDPEFEALIAGDAGFPAHSTEVTGEEPDDWVHGFTPRLFKRKATGVFRGFCGVLQGAPSQGLHTADIRRPYVSCLVEVRARTYVR